MPLAATRADALRLELDSVEIRHLVAVGTVPGVVILAVAGRNGPGTARIRNDASALSWQAPGSSEFGTPVVCGADGTYLLEDGGDWNKWARIQVYADYLASGLTEAQVYLADVYENGVSHDDVTASQAAAGDVEAYEITLTNDSPLPLEDVRVWVISCGTHHRVRRECVARSRFLPSRWSPLIQSSTRREISGLHRGAGQFLTADRFATDVMIQKTGLGSWYAPDSENHPDVLIWPYIGPGETEPLHCRREICAGARSNPSVLTVLHFGWNGL